MTDKQCLPNANSTGLISKHINNESIVSTIENKKRFMIILLQAYYITQAVVSLLFTGN